MWILPLNQGGGQRFSSGSVSTSAITTGDAESGGGAVSDLTLLTVTVSRHPYGGGIEYVRTDDRANRGFRGRGRHSHRRRKLFRGSRWWYGDHIYMFGPSTKWNTPHHTERTCIGRFDSNNSARCGVRLSLVLAILV